MIKVTFLGAGSSVFCKKLLGDCLINPDLHDYHFALYDIDPVRLGESKQIIEALNVRYNKGKAMITVHCGADDRKNALRDADFVINAMNIGGYKPATVTDFKIPEEFGLRQTVADTLGIGGIFRGLRSVHVIKSVCREMESVCPNAWFLNYANPMAINTGAILKGSAIKAVGLCHSVQDCATGLLQRTGLLDKVKDLRWKVAGINHMAWLLSLYDGSKDLYPEVKEAAFNLNQTAFEPGGEKHRDIIRFEIMLKFGYYVTESSSHSAEYTPYWIKNNYPELISKYNITLDEYLEVCERLITRWNEQKETLLNEKTIAHEKSFEYGSVIIDSIATGTPSCIHGNILNKKLIFNLPENAVVEVPCLVDKNGIQGTAVGDLPEVCAALNRTAINMQNLATMAALEGKKELIYHAAFLDPHTSAELSIDKIVQMCDRLIQAHGNLLPKYV